MKVKDATALRTTSDAWRRRSQTATSHEQSRVWTVQTLGAAAANDRSITVYRPT